MFPSLRTNAYGPPMSSLGGYKFTTRSNDGCRVDQTDRVLASHGLERVKPDLAQHSVFGALSLCLFKNQTYEGLLMRRVRETLHEIVTHGKVPMRLHAFKNNRSLSSSFNSKPYQENFHRYVFDLVSLAFEVRVVVCAVQHHTSQLSETIYANKYRRQIRVLEAADGTYEALFPKGTFEKDKLEDGTIEAVSCPSPSDTHQDLQRERRIRTHSWSSSGHQLLRRRRP